MDKIKIDVYFRENYDMEAVDEICEKFDEADQWYSERRVQFNGDSEKYQEFFRAVRTVAEIEKTFTY